jgi:S-DNA-T family DNA segregation ATPase FtsK/SpoIIIE
MPKTKQRRSTSPVVAPAPAPTVCDKADILFRSAAECCRQHRRYARLVEMGTDESEQRAALRLVGASDEQLAEAGLRATQDVITAAMKKQSRVRVGMRVTDPEELGHLFPTGIGRLNPKAAPHRGCGWFAAPDDDDMIGDPGPFKAFRITPKMIRALSPAFAARRPVLERVFLNTEPGRYYASRWGRVLPRLYKGQQLAPVTIPYTDMEILHPPIDEITGIPKTGSAPAGDGGKEPGTSTSTTGPTTEASSGRSFAPAGLAALLSDIAQPDPGPADHDQVDADDSTVIRAEFGRVVAQAGMPPTRPNPVPELLARAHQETVAAGGRIHTKDLAARLGMDATALGTELRTLLTDVGVSRPGAGTVRAGADSESKPGYYADTLAEAIRAYSQRATS